MRISLPATVRASAVAVVLSLPWVAAAAEAPAAPAPAKKAKALPVALALTPNAQGQAAQVGYIVESAVRRSLKHEFVDPAEKFDPTGVGYRLEKQTRARDAVAFGRRAYENLEDGLGIESFNRAISAFEESALWENFQGLSGATVLRILVKWSEDQTETRKEVARLMAVDPRIEFPPDLTPPELAAEVTRAREQRKNEEKFSLDVSTEPVAARVYVDGVYRGTSPTSVRGLVGGEHYLSLVAPGYSVIQKKVRAGPGATTTETLKQADRSGPFHVFLERIKKGFTNKDEVNAAQLLGRLATADETLVVGVSRNAGRVTIEFHRIVVSDGHVISLGTLDLAENDPAFATKVDEAAKKVLATDRERGTNNAPLAVRSELANFVDNISNVSPDKIRIGVGVTGGVLMLAGLGLGLSASAQETELRALPQRNPNVDQISSSGFAKAVTADVLLGVGAVAVGTWAWLQFGKAASAKADLPPPTVLEKPKAAPPPPEKKEPEKDKRIDEWDPFAAASDEESGMTAGLFAGFGSTNVVGVQGTF